MNVAQAVLSRRSIRAFKTQPVARQILVEILHQALRAPSWGNTQPWKLTLVGGRTLERIRQEFLSLVDQDVPPRMDITMPVEFNRVQTERYKEMGKQLYTKLGIARHDQGARNEHYARMTNFFGAPYLLYFHLDKGFNPYALLDCGIIMQTVALLAQGQGVGSCILARSCRYPDVVRKHSGIPEDQVLIMGMALGTPEEDHPANLFRSNRGLPEEFIRLVDVK